MVLNWDEVNKALSPLKDFEDMRSRFRVSFAYPFVGAKFNLTMPELASYTQRLLGGDARHRYTDYCDRLVAIFTQLHQAGVIDLLDLVKRVETRDAFAVFVEQSGIPAVDLVAVLKYLIYWFIPGEKYLSGLILEDTVLSEAIKVLRGCGVKTNLDILQQGITPAGRKVLAEAYGLPEAVINDLVNRADFSRLPWASKATISNIIGAGYNSLAQLASADPEQLYADFFRYGKIIGKNLKLGNEIENSYRIARIVPVLLA